MNQPNAKLAELVISAKPKCGETVVIAIDGPAGSGKTTFASQLHDLVSNSGVVHMDDLYRGWDNTLTPDLSFTLQKLLSDISSRRQLSYQKYDWELHKLAQPTDSSAPKILILEGVGAGQKSIEEFVSILIWIEVPTLIGLERVIQRDGIEVAPFMEEFLQSQSRHFEQEDTKKRADYHLSGLPTN